MTDQEKLRLVQLMYAGALADAVAQYGAHGVLAAVEERKKPEQMRQGAEMARRLCAQTPCEVPTAVANVFGCAAWTVADAGPGFSAETKACLMCAMAKRMGAPQPCALYCINPMKGMIQGLDAELSVRIDETLWTGARCFLEATKTE